MNYIKRMRLFSRNTLAEYWAKHPETKASLEHWLNLVKNGQWSTMSEVQKAFPKAKVIDGEKVRFEVHGGDYRLIAAFDFQRRMVFVKFIGTHAEYDRIDPKTVSQF